MRHDNRYRPGRNSRPERQSSNGPRHRDQYDDRYDPRDYQRSYYRNDVYDEYERDERSDRYHERDSDIYEDEFEQEEHYSRRPSEHSGYGRVRGLRNSNTVQRNGDYDQDDRNDESYDYSSDPYYRDDEDDYAYAGRYTQEYRNRKEHAPLDEEGRWEYSPRSRSIHRSLNRRTRSDYYNGLSSGYDY